MNKTGRKETIIELLRYKNGLPVRIIAEKLGVSHMTVRRDLEELASEGRVRLIHGGVLLNPRLNHGSERPYSLGEAGGENAAVKARIGRRAAELIKPNETLIIDSGSTTEYLADCLPDDRDLTVIGYSLNIISRTARMSRVRSIFAGGLLHANTLMFESPEGLALIRRYRAGKAFISAAGVSPELGVTCRNGYERETKITVIDSSVQKILLADSSKFGVVRSDYFADIGCFDIIVTDFGLDESVAEDLRSRGIEVILA